MVAAAKRRRSEEEANAAWMAEAQRELDGGASAPSAHEASPSPSPQFAWPDTIHKFACAQCSITAASRGAGSVRAAAATVAALRLAHTFHLRKGSSWCDHAERALSQHLTVLRTEDAEFAASARAFHGSGVLHNAGGGTGPAALRMLRVLGAFDALHWALWALACRRRICVPHPVRLSEQVSRALLREPRCAAAVRRVLRLDAAAARALGVRQTWLDGASASPVWEIGECTMLRLLRARWVEAVCHVATVTIDASDARVRSSLLRWQLIGRDACARHMAFAVPSRAALCALRDTLGGGSGGGLVELGAGNGYWCKMLVRLLAANRDAKGGGSGAKGSSRPTIPLVRALDSAPPPEWRQPKEVRVEIGSADDLTSVDGGPPTTLLLCMPSPGEPGLAEEALAAFGGSFIAYVGEWGSGMTSTRRLHADLLSRDYELLSSLPLPCMPLTRIALHIFRRKAPRDKPTKTPLNLGAACVGCGGRERLRACPWVRSIVVCSEACHAQAAEEHARAISWLYCGAPCATRPRFDEFHPAAEVFLEAGSAREAEWIRLAHATPQPERELPP